MEDLGHGYHNAGQCPILYDENYNEIKIANEKVKAMSVKVISTINPTADSKYLYLVI